MKRTHVALLWLAALTITLGAVVWQRSIHAPSPQRGAVPALLLLPQIAIMFLGMLFSNAALLSALARREQARRQGWVALTLLSLGGLVLGSAVHRYAAGTWWGGTWWAGGLSGHDLTGFQAVVAVAAWGVALLVARGTRWGGEPERRAAWVAIVAAGVVTLAVLVVPPSLFGSRLDLP